MAFTREQDTMVHETGTLIICRVRDKETGKLRQMMVTITPDQSIESEDAKLLIEECYKTCERHLQKDVVKLNAQIS